MEATRLPKGQRLNVRVSERQETLIRRAADATGRTITDFVVASASVEAERVLSDRRWFDVSEAQWQEFEELLEAPLPSTEKLRRLLQRETPFGS